MMIIKKEPSRTFFLLLLLIYYCSINCGEVTNLLASQLAPRFCKKDAIPKLVSGLVLTEHFYPTRFMHDVSFNHSYKHILSVSKSFLSDSHTLMNTSEATQGSLVDCISQLWTSTRANVISCSSGWRSWMQDQRFT